MAKTIELFTPEIPSSDAWPYRRAYSSRSIVYYLLTDEATLPKVDNRFWKTVGRNIKTLGMVLTRAGCHFVPQSEGQFLSLSDLKDVWNSIKAEEKIIRKSGLELINFDTGESTVFQKKDYRSPWQTFEDFEVDVSPKAKMGCVFFLIPEILKTAKAIMKEEPFVTPYTNIQIVYDIIEASDPQGQSQAFSLHRINMNCKNEFEIESEWIAVTNYMHKLLETSKKE